MRLKDGLYLKEYCYPCEEFYFYIVKGDDIQHNYAYMTNNNYDFTGGLQSTKEWLYPDKNCLITYLGNIGE